MSQYADFNGTHQMTNPLNRATLSVHLTPLFAMHNYCNSPTTKLLHPISHWVISTRLVVLVSEKKTGQMHSIVTSRTTTAHPGELSTNRTLFLRFHRSRQAGLFSSTLTLAGKYLQAQRPNRSQLSGGPHQGLLIGLTKRRFRQTWLSIVRNTHPIG